MAAMMSVGIAIVGLMMFNQIFTSLRRMQCALARLYVRSDL